MDYRHWNPETDPKIAAHYTPEKLDGKLACRRDLLHAVQLDHSRTDRPVLGIVSRAATQKGFDFIAEIAGRLAEREAYLVVLAQGEPYYENLAASPSAIPIVSLSASRMTKRSRTRSKPGATCS